MTLEHEIQPLWNYCNGQAVLSEGIAGDSMILGNGANPQGCECRFMEARAAFWQEARSKV
jgi:hypothetical protein